MTVGNIVPLVLIQIVTFVVIIIVLQLLFGSHLQNALKRLQALHQESLEKEEILNKELQRAKAQSQSEIARSKEEAKKIIESARKSAEKISLEASERADIEIRKVMAEAQQKAKSIESEVLAGAEEKSVELSRDLIKLTFTQRGCEALHAQFIEELIEELRKLDREKLPVKVDKVEVMTSAALGPAAKKGLKELFSEKLGKDVAIEEKVDDSLIIGIIIRLGGLIIDGSLKNKLSKAMNVLRTQKA